MIAAQLDPVAVRVGDVHRPTDTPCAPSFTRAIDNIEPWVVGDGVDVGPIYDQADVIDVVTGAFERKQVDDAVVVDSDRWEEHLTGPPLVDALSTESQDPGVPGERTLDIADIDHEVVELADVHR